MRHHGFVLASALLMTAPLPEGAAYAEKFLSTRTVLRIPRVPR